MTFAEQVQLAEDLEYVISNLTEGASDEKRMAIVYLENLANRLQSDIKEFESDMDTLCELMD